MSLGGSSHAQFHIHDTNSLIRFFILTTTPAPHRYSLKKLGFNQGVYGSGVHIILFLHFWNTKSLNRCRFICAFSTDKLCFNWRFKVSDLHKSSSRIQPQPQPQSAGQFWIRPLWHDLFDTHIACIVHFFIYNYLLCITF